MILKAKDKNNIAPYLSWVNTDEIPYLTWLSETLQDIFIKKQISYRKSQRIRGKLLGKKVRTFLKELETCLVVIFILLDLECSDYVNIVIAKHTLHKKNDFNKR